VNARSLFKKIVPPDEKPERMQRNPEKTDTLLLHAC